LKRAALGGLGLALLAIIAAEALNGPGNAGDPAPSAPTPAEPTSPPPVPAERREADYVAAILARPLFTPDRKPATAKTTRHDDGADRPAELPRLSGILMVKGVGRAIFQASDGAKPVTIGIGETIGGWTILGITIDGVAMTGPGGPRTLTPAGDPTLVSAPPPQGARPPGIPPINPINPGFPNPPAPPPNLSSNIPRNNITQPIPAISPPNSVPVPRKGRENGRGVN
jgi:hypothetical protein